MVIAPNVPDVASVRRIRRQTGLRARDNPFRVERVHTFRYRPVGVSWDTILEKLHGMQFRGAIVGPEGSGKTTFLEDLQERLIESGHSTRWLQLRRDTRRMARRLVRETLANSAPPDILFVDGAEQIGAVTWRRLAFRTRRHAGLIITVHRAGRLPTFIECATSLPLLEDMVRDLAPALFHVLQPKLPSLFARHRGNIRLCLREIYNWLTVGDAPSR